MSCSQEAARRYGRAPDACVRTGLFSGSVAGAPAGERLVGQHAAVLGRPLRARGIEHRAERTAYSTREQSCRTTVQVVVRRRGMRSGRTCAATQWISIRPPSRCSLAPGAATRRCRCCVMRMVHWYFWGAGLPLSSYHIEHWNTEQLHRNLSTLFSCGTSIAEINCATFRRTMFIARWCVQLCTLELASLFCLLHHNFISSVLSVWFWFCDAAACSCTARSSWVRSYSRAPAEAGISCASSIAALSTYGLRVTTVTCSYPYSRIENVLDLVLCKLQTVASVSELPAAVYALDAQREAGAHSSASGRSSARSSSSSLRVRIAFSYVKKVIKGIAHKCYNIQNENFSWILLNAFRRIQPEFCSGSRRLLWPQRISFLFCAGARNNLPIEWS